MRGHLSKYWPLRPAVPKFSKNVRRHLKILCVRIVTWSKFHSEYLQVLGAILQNLVARTIWCSDFVRL